MLKLRTAPNKRNWFLRDWQLYFMLLLPIAYYILFKYMPMYGTLIAFKKFSAKKGIWGSTWVGFKNFEKFLSDPYFYKLVRNTLLINLNNLLFAFTSSIIFALLLNEMKHKLYRKVVQTVCDRLRCGHDGRNDLLTAYRYHLLPPPKELYRIHRRLSKIEPTNSKVRTLE